MTELNVVEEDETGLETTAVQRWSWHEKQTFCSVWESICVGKKKRQNLVLVRGSRLCLRGEDDSVFFFFFLNCTGYKIPPTSGLSRRRIKLNVLLWRDMRARRCISIA